MTKEPDEAEWTHAVLCSYQALEDEKTALAILDHEYTVRKVYMYEQAEQERMLRVATERLEEARRRIRGWESWFAKHNKE